jgi:hypothetical protein
MKYGDAVVLVRVSPPDPNQPDAVSVVSRLFALVVASQVQPDGAEKFSPKKVEVTQALKAPGGKIPVGGEYLDVMFLAPLPEGAAPKSRQAEDLFAKALHVAPFADGKFIGWEPIAAYYDSSDEEFSYAAFESLFGDNAKLRNLLRDVHSEVDQLKATVVELSTPKTPISIETKNYSDGSSATGPAPLPELSPAQQAAQKVPGETEGTFDGPAFQGSSPASASIAAVVAAADASTAVVGTEKAQNSLTSDSPATE